MGTGSRVSLTDLHKGTHNCAAAIRESGAGISPSTPFPPFPPLPSPPPPPPPPLPLSHPPVSPGSPLVVHPVGPPSTSPAVPPAGRGDGARALSQCALLSFFHTSGRRCRRFPAWHYGAPAVFSLPPSLSSVICPFTSGSLLLPRRFSDTFEREKATFLGREYFSLI